MNQKSRYYIGIFTILFGAGLILYALLVESTINHPIKKKEILLGAPLLILLGSFRVYSYKKNFKKKE